MTLNSTKKWASTAIKWVTQVRYGLGQPPPPSIDGIPIIRATNIHRGKIVTQGLIRADIKDLPLDRTPLLKAGEILVVRSGAYTGDSALVTPEWEGSAPGYDLRITPIHVDSRFLAYTMLSAPVAHQINIVSSRAAQPHLNAEELGDIRIPLPPIEEQQRIADFLDDETAKIDRLLQACRREVDLTQERSIAMAFDAIRGRKEPGERAHSGLAWLGDIPASWPVLTISSQFDVRLGKMLNEQRSQGSHLKPYLRVVNVQWDQIDTTDLALMDFPPHERRRYEVLPGDLLICEGGSYPGRAAIWDGRITEIYYQKALHRARSRGRSSVRWLYYCLRVARAMGVFEAEGNTTTMTHLTSEQLATHKFPFPSPPIQHRLVDMLDNSTEHDKKLVSKLERQLDLIQERKQALITAAVTGQIDVTTAHGIR